MKPTDPGEFIASLNAGVLAQQMGTALSDVAANVIEHGKKGKVIGYHDATGVVPNFVQLLRRRGIKVDMSIFKPTHRESS